MTAEEKRERACESARRSYRKHRDRHLARDKAYREENAERIREQRKARYYANLEENRRDARERMRRLNGSKPMEEHLRERRATATARKASVTVATRPPKASAPQRSAVPAELRQAYSRAHDNSVLRRKYPTMAHLVRAFS